MTPGTAPHHPQRRGVVSALVCWAAAVAAAVIVPLGAAGDPALAEDVADLGSATWWVVVSALTAQALALAWLHAAPRIMLPVIAAITLCAAGFGLGGLFGLTSFAVIVGSYLAFVERPMRVTRGTGVLTAALSFAANVVSGLRDGDLGLPVVLAGGVAQTAFIVGAPAVVALLVSSRRDIRQAQELEVQALAREHDALVREARAQERTAMARELHDIAAHHLSGIAVMAAAVERQIATDPDAAREGVRQVRTQSTAVLRDLRRLVGLLRESDAGELAVETLNGIAQLTAQAATLGAPVELVTLAKEGGGPLGAGLGPLAHLTAYRLVQESLANALQHAPGARCQVIVDDLDLGSVLVTVRNEAAAAAALTRPGGGLGLVGMRERAELTGADLRYGPTIDGGWDVTLRLTRDITGSEER